MVDAVVILLVHMMLKQMQWYVHATLVIQTLVLAQQSVVLVILAI